MKLADLFDRSVTRDIPPVVYFHQQDPVQLAAEVGEYIVTGGYPEGHSSHQRVPVGIHEQYVRLLDEITRELAKSGGPENPACWISGFYGSGKSSFAKLLGLALHGVSLPDGRSLSGALLARDQSPRAAEFAAAFQRLRTAVEPIAVVFDIGGQARDGEHIHATIVRMVAEQLHYCRDPHVAETELKLERDGHYQQFLATAEATLGGPWSTFRDRALADDYFSQVMARLFPDRFTDPQSWVMGRAGTHAYSTSAVDAVRAIADMLRFREPTKTLFIVVDEVSQYVHDDEGRMLALQSFVSELGSRLRGKAWLLATGQQKLEEGGDGSTIGKMKARFPERLRVHLSATNIRDVVHRRLLAKADNQIAGLRALFQRHRNDLRLFAYGCEHLSDHDFVEVYPLLPGYIDLILQITSAIRSRSRRSQGDDQAIRGLLQLLGELFRQGLADAPLGTLITLDRVYDIQHTALDSDTQAAMARIQHHCASADLPLALRAAKVVALLQLVAESQPPDARLVAQCLHDRLDAPSQLTAVTEALEALRRASFLAYTEREGYKLQSPAGEEWARDRADLQATRDDSVRHAQGALRDLIGNLEKPKLDGRPLAWLGLFSDGRRAVDVRLTDGRDPAAITLDLRYVAAEERSTDTWINRSAESGFHNRLIWVAGDTEDFDAVAREFTKSEAMVRKHKARGDALSPDKRRLLLEEEGRADELRARLRREVEAAWLGGQLYFRGHAYAPRDLGASLGVAIARAADRFARDLYPHFVAVRVTDAEVLQLIDKELHSPSRKFIDDLGLLSEDAGRYAATCKGVIPTRIMEFLDKDGAASGAALLAAFGGPPYGLAPELVRASVAALLRASRLRIRPEQGGPLTAVRDAGVREVLERDREFKSATFEPVGASGIQLKTRVRLAKFIEDHRLGGPIDREDGAIADRMSEELPKLSARVRELFTAWRRLPGNPQPPDALIKLDDALTYCFGRLRKTDEAVRALEQRLDAFLDGLPRLAAITTELTDAAIDAVSQLDQVVRYQLTQLEQLGALEPGLVAIGERLRAQLAGEHPWRGAVALADDVEQVRAAYRVRRQALLNEQADQLDAARRAVRGLDGFATLAGDKAHHVLRPLGEVAAITDADATAPTLAELRDAFARRLPAARAEATDRLDAVLSEGNAPPVRRLPVNLSGREIKDEADLERVLDELRQRVREQLKAGGRVRLA